MTRLALELVERERDVARAALARLTDLGAKRIMALTDDELMTLEIKEVGRDAADEISRWTQKWVEAFAAHSALAQVVRAEAQVVEDARNILHAHNRPEPQRLPNEQRIAARGLLEGAARRLRDALEAARP